jgi:hypothetical protein
MDEASEDLAVVGVARLADPLVRAPLGRVKICGLAVTAAADDRDAAPTVPSALESPGSTRSIRIPVGSPPGATRTWTASDSGTMSGSVPPREPSASAEPASGA